MMLKEVLRQINTDKIAGNPFDSLLLLCEHFDDFQSQVGCRDFAISVEQL